MLNEWETYTDEANDLDDELRKVVEPILQKWCDRGYKMNDVMYVALSSVDMAGTFMKAKRNMEKLKEVRSERGGVFNQLDLFSE
jgi:hypothetical protein